MINITEKAKEMHDRHIAEMRLMAEKTITDITNKAKAAGMPVSRVQPIIDDINNKLNVNIAESERMYQEFLQKNA